MNDDAMIDPSEAQPLRGSLTLRRAGEETDVIFPLGPTSTIGRFDPSVGPIDVDLGTIPEGSYVSRRHAKMELTQTGAIITDLGSSNGTYVLRDDFEKVDEAEVESGGEVSFGNARFVFRLVTPEIEDAQAEAEADSVVE